jgi:ferredoxin
VRAEADRAVCVGAGMCALVAPAVFGQDDDEGRVVLLDARPADGAAAREAVRLCPSGAIAVRA